MPQKGYDTGMASEFLVLSILYKRGVNPSLTFGNNKNIDIILTSDNEIRKSIDVKGMTGRYNFPAFNFKGIKNHYYVFVCFPAKPDSSVMPDIYIVPSYEVSKLITHTPKWKGIKITTLESYKERYLRRWDYLE